MVNKNDLESCTMNEWINIHPSEEDMETVFLNMDIALKYLHEHNYCIEDFSFDEIDVLKNNPRYIEFKKYCPQSTSPIDKKKEVADDIFYSAILQICSYLHMPLNHLNIGYLKENFDSFAQFLPTGDVPYYRGVIQRGASVYLCEYILEKRNRDLANLERELGETEGNGKALVKSSPNRIDSDALSNDAINDNIYKINGYLDKVAFVNLLLLPTIIVFTLLVLGMIAWVISLF